MCLLGQGALRDFDPISDNYDPTIVSKALYVDFGTDHDGTQKLVFAEQISHSSHHGFWD